MVFDIKMGSLLSDKHNRVQSLPKLLRPQLHGDGASSIKKTRKGDTDEDDEFLIGTFCL